MTRGQLQKSLKIEMEKLILSLSLSKWPPYPQSILVVWWWCSNPQIEARGTLGSAPYMFR